MFKIKEYRKRAGLTQVELATILNMSKGTVSTWETGLRVPSTSVLLRICDVLNVTLAQLTGEEDAPKPVTKVSINDVITLKYLFPHYDTCICNALIHASTLLTKQIPNKTPLEISLDLLKKSAKERSQTINGY